MSSHSHVHDDPLIGTTIADRYRIEERIGVGAMGAVYRAMQEGLDRPVALKVLKRDLSWGGDTEARFRREAHAMSALIHPNTVRVYDFGATTSGMLYLAMELLEGELATERLFRQGALDPMEAVVLTQQILRSVAEAHGKKIIHRDIKPDNIFLARVDGHAEPVVKVLDFGIAKAVEGERTLNQFETQDGTVFGTPRYMSPEQAQGKALDTRSDLYAIGILLYELLTGSPPFVDDDAVIVMAKHIREPVTPVRKAAIDRPIPASLETVVSRALEKDPNKRFGSAEEFDKALNECIPDIERLRDTGVPRPSFVDRLREVPPERKRTWTTVGVSLAVGATLALGAFVLLFDDDAAAVTSPSRPTNNDADNAPTATEDPMVMLESDPTHATVWFDGQVLGLTPIAVVLPQGAPMRIELRKDGYEMTQLDLTASPATQRFELTPVTAVEPTPVTTVVHPTGPEPGGTSTARRPAQRARPAARKVNDRPSAPYERFE